MYNWTSLGELNTGNIVNLSIPTVDEVPSMLYCNEVYTHSMELGIKMVSDVYLSKNPRSCALIGVSGSGTHVSYNYLTVRCRQNSHVF